MVYSSSFLYSLQRRNLPRKAKFAKLKEFLDSRKSEFQHHAASYTIGTNHYVLNYEISGHNFYLCPTALARLIHVGEHKLSEVARGCDDDLPPPLLKNSKEKIHKYNLIDDWMELLVLPACDIDEIHPSYKRMEEMDFPKDAYENFKSYLDELYPNKDSSLSYCCQSWFEREIRKKYSHILWGLSCYCADCASFALEKRDLKKSRSKCSPNEQAKLDSRIREIGEFEATHRKKYAYF